MTGKIQMTTRPPRPKKSLKERQATKEMARRCSRRRGIQASRTDPVIDVNEPLEDVMRRRVKGEINSRQWKKYHSSQTAVTKEEAKKSFQTVAQQIHKEVSIQAKSKRKVIKAETLSKLTELKTTNPNFNAVYEKVVDLFATALKNDKELLGKDGRLPATNLVGKWAPTIDCAIDKHTRLARNIAAALYPASEHQKENESEDMFRQRVYTNYRKEYLNPLRQNIDVPERKMSRNKWSEINYPRVPSVSMKRSKEVFLKRDAERFQSFLGEVKAGTKKMASGALMPHEIVRDLRRSSGEKKELEEVAELQWNSYVDKLKQVGIFNSALAVADVSGSMEGDPMEVSIALSLLTAALSKPPFNGVICTFSESPQLQVVNQPTLKEKIQFTANMDWGGSTNFQGIFNLLLELAKKTNMPADEMVKTIFVFSDMEFNIAGGEEYETDYKLIERKFQEAGYPLPSIVFWNLRGGRRSKPVTATQSNVALVSGFSGQMMKSFLESGDFENPLVSMLKSLGSHYDHLKVVD